MDSKNTKYKKKILSPRSFHLPIQNTIVLDAMESERKLSDVTDQFTFPKDSFPKPRATINPTQPNPTKFLLRNNSKPPPIAD